MFRGRALPSGDLHCRHAVLGIVVQDTFFGNGSNDLAPIIRGRFHQVNYRPLMRSDGDRRDQCRLPYFCV